jgi:hypothetical protein
MKQHLRVRHAMSLSEEEIELLIAKLRSKYASYAEKYSEKWFNPRLFEERLQMALRNRMNLEGFILAEIKNFEEIRKKYDKKKKERPFSEKIDKIMEEHTAHIKKYPPLHFHPAAGFEISHFYGALSLFTLTSFPILWLVVTDQDKRKKLQQFENALSELAVPRGDKPPGRIEDHMLILSRRDSRELDIERDKNNYLKESAFILHEIIHFCDELLHTKNDEWETPLRFDKLYIQGEHRKEIIKLFTNQTGYGAIMTTMHQAQAIIDDFRLDAFKRK